MAKRWFLLAMMVLAALLGVRATTPPAPLGADASPQAFAAGRATADVRAMAARPHVAASPENAMVRAHIARRLLTMGMQVHQAPFTAPKASADRLAWWSGKPDPAPTLNNLIGVLPGRDRGLPAVLLLAHPHTLVGSPAPAVDTAGCSPSLEPAPRVPVEVAPGAPPVLSNTV